MVARRLIPDLAWCVVSADRRTDVMAPAEQLIWDLSYFATEVSAQSALNSVFEEKLDGADYEVFKPEEIESTEHTRYFVAI